MKIKIFHFSILFFVLFNIQGQTSIEFNEKGIEKYNSKDYLGALQDYNKAIKLDPDYSNAYYNRGLSKSELKNYSGAMQDYNKACLLYTSRCV